MQDFRPLYEKVFDGRLQINWQIGKTGYYYGFDEKSFVRLTFIDSSNNMLENQISDMIFEVPKGSSLRMLEMLDENGQDMVKRYVITQ